MISIIIPTLNEEKYIGRLLTDLESQTYTDYDVIVVDGNSDDGTFDIVKKYHKVKFIQSNVRNVSKQRNKGVLLSQGDTLFFLDADLSLPDSNFLKNLMHEFNAVAMNVNIKIPPDEEKLVDKAMYGLFNATLLLSRVFRMHGARGCLMVKKSYFDKAKGYNESIKVSEDSELFRRLAQFGKVSYSQQIIYESPRRYRKMGYFKTIAVWTLNGIWSFLFNTSLINQKHVR